MAFPGYLGFSIIQIIDLTNFARLRNSLIRVEFASPRYLGLKIIQIIILPHSARLCCFLYAGTLLSPTSVLVLFK